MAIVRAKQIFAKPEESSPILSDILMLSKNMVLLTYLGFEKTLFWLNKVSLFDVHDCQWTLRQITDS